jgi:ankyrin repeat protein
MRISKEDDHPLRWKCKFIVNKIHARNEQGQTPLILAIQSKQYEFAELLLDNKANINMTDSHGCSPLQYVCQQGNPQMLKKLIDRGADPHYFNRRYNFILAYIVLS